MGLISSEDAARRLARAIASDLLLYNQEAFQAGADLGKEVEEGRELFRSRVADSLHPVYEQVVVEMFQRARGGTSSTSPSRPGTSTPARPVPRAQPGSRPPARSAPYEVHGNDEQDRPGSGPRGTLMLAVGIAVAVAVFLVLRWLSAHQG